MNSYSSSSSSDISSTSVMIKYIMNKFHNMTYTNATKFLLKLYELYNFYEDEYP